jgi:hypothetical protein
MEKTKGNSLCSCLYLKLAKTPCFSFYLLGFFFYEIEEQRVEWVLPRGWGWHQWEGGGVRQGGKKVNMVQIMYTHVCKCKNDTC